MTVPAALVDDLMQTGFGVELTLFGMPQYAAMVSNGLAALCLLQHAG